MPFVAFMAKWLTTARGVRRTRPLSSISRCTTTLGNRCAPKKRVGSVTPAQDDGRETCHLGGCSIPACGYLNRATRRHTRFCGNKSRRASAERAVLIASSQRKERVESLSRQARLKSWIEPFRGVMQKPPDWLFCFAMALDRGANLRMAGQLPSPRSGLRDQSTHERGLDQNRDDPPYGAKARLSILRQVLRDIPL